MPKRGKGRRGEAEDELAAAAVDADVQSEVSEGDVVEVDELAGPRDQFRDLLEDLLAKRGVTRVRALELLTGLCQRYVLGDEEFFSPRIETVLTHVGRRLKADAVESALAARLLGQVFLQAPESAAPHLDSTQDRLTAIIQDPALAPEARAAVGSPHIPVIGPKKHLWY